jgi:hypothetical protein
MYVDLHTVKIDFSEEEKEKNGNKLSQMKKRKPTLIKIKVDKLVIY